MFHKLFSFTITRESPPKPGLGHRGVPGQSSEPLGNVVYINTQHLRIFSCILGWGI